MCPVCGMPVLPGVCGQRIAWPVGRESCDVVAPGEGWRAEGGGSAGGAHRSMKSRGSLVVRLRACLPQN